MSNESATPSEADDPFSVFGSGHGSRGRRSSKPRETDSGTEDDEPLFVIAEGEFLACARDLKALVDASVVRHPQSAHAALRDLEEHGFRVEMQNRAAGKVEHLISAPFSLVGRVVGEASDSRRELHIFCLIITERPWDHDSSFTVDWDENTARSELLEYGVSISG